MTKQMVCVIVFISSLSATWCGAAEDTSIILERIKPVGQVNVEKNAATTSIATAVTTSTTVAQAPGQKIYETKCAVCHGAGVAGAPKLHDTQAWKPRLVQGKDILIKHVTEGFKAMPPKGTCTECTEGDLKTVIEYMTANK